MEEELSIVPLVAFVRPAWMENQRLEKELIKSTTSTMVEATERGPRAQKFETREFPPPTPLQIDQLPWRTETPTMVRMPFWCPNLTHMGGHKATMSEK